MKKVLIILIIVGIVIFGIAGFGFYNGYRTKTYAKNVNSIMADSNSKWSIDKFENEGQTNTDSLKLLEGYANTMKTDCQAQSTKLDTLKAPGKAKQLGLDTNSYFDTCVTVADQVLVLTTYTNILTEIGTSMASLSSTGSSDMTVLANQLDQTHQKFSESIKKLKAANPPTSFKEYNQQFITALEQMDNLFVQLSAAAKANDTSQMTTLSTQLSSTGSQMSNLKAPDTNQMTTEMVSADQKSKLQTLPAKIKTQADSLTNTLFILSF